MTLEQSRFVANQVSAPASSGGATGGAARARISGAELSRNAFAGNQSSEAASAVYFSAVNPPDRPLLRLSNSLFQANSGLSTSTQAGAALFIQRATLRMRNNTLSFNAAGASGLAADLFIAGNVVLDAVSNNVFERSALGRSCAFQSGTPAPPVAAGSRNYFGDSSCTWRSGVGTQTIAPMFFTLSSPSLTLAPGVFVTSALPLRESAITDGGASGVSATDFALCAQDDIEGNPRPFDNNGDALANCTAGAVERNSLFPNGPPLFQDGFEG